jgi:hypothetical protein
MIRLPSTVTYRDLVGKRRRSSLWRADSKREARALGLRLPIFVGLTQRGGFNVLQLPLTQYQDGAMGVAHHFFCHTTQQVTLEPGVSVGGNDNKLGSTAGCLLTDFFTGTAADHAYVNFEALRNQGPGQFLQFTLGLKLHLTVQIIRLNAQTAGGWLHHGEQSQLAAFTQAQHFQSSLQGLKGVIGKINGHHDVGVCGKGKRRRGHG